MEGTKMKPCRDCAGHGKVFFQGHLVPCIICKGSGEVEEDETNESP
ncbi:hypothetical protein [Ammoniphilus sp. 3BR4]